MKRIKRSEIVLLAIIGTLLLVGGLAVALFPAPQFSESENRMLAEAPRFSREALPDGSYTLSWESYAAERMPGRRLLRGVRAAAELSLGKGEVGNVILCVDGSLSKRLTVNERAYQKNCKTITKIATRMANNATPLTVAVVPPRIEARAAVLPALYKHQADTAPDRALTAALPSAMVCSNIKADSEWFRTDHHWTAEGAYAAYVALAPALGYAPHKATDFSRQVVSECFFGTTDAAAGILGTLPDKIELWRYREDGSLQLTRDGKRAPFGGIYDLDKLQTRDGYAVFLGGNCGITEIDLGADDTRPTLLVIKDSFANALIPFLARHYRILAVDPRYTAVGLEALLPQADQALLLCGMQTLTEAAVLDALLK